MRDGRVCTVWWWGPVVVVGRPCVSGHSRPHCTPTQPRHCLLLSFCSAAHNALQHFPLSKRTPSEANTVEIPLNRGCQSLQQWPASVDMTSHSQHHSHRLSPSSPFQLVAISPCCGSKHGICASAWPAQPLYMAVCCCLHGAHGASLSSHSERGASEWTSCCLCQCDDVGG